MKDITAPPQVPLRPPETVMRLRRMGAAFPTRLSFMRILLRALAADDARVTRPVWQMNDAGFGHAVYTLRFGGFDYALIAVSTDLAPDQRTDRVIANAWDTAFVLYDGIPDAAEITRIIATAPQQEAARFTARDWTWACAIDYDEPAACAQFWYVSEEKLEPRLGNRHVEPGADCETRLDIARQVKALATDLTGDGPVGQFLANYPAHRAAVRRVQTLASHPYAEIRDNLIDADCLPIDILRCKLAFFGASKFDPKSDRWTRITLAQGAPLFDELDTADDWWLPTVCV